MVRFGAQKCGCIINICNIVCIRNLEIDFIILAGYLKLIPVELIRAYQRSIINIHPSLLPAFGGKGYYGMKVHRAVVASGARYASCKISPHSLIDIEFYIYLNTESLIFIYLMFVFS